MSFKYPDSSNDSKIFADERTVSYYSSKAAHLAEQYSEAGDLFCSLFEKYLNPKSTVLDIGCGSGRDLAALNQSGFSVTGADSSTEMISASVIKYPELGDKIKLSGLPDLSEIDNTFTGILCSAVLQHIPDRNLYESFRRIRELLKDKGIFIVSFPIKYPGIDPETSRDKEGRLFYLRPEKKYRFLIERLGFTLIDGITGNDSLGREGVVWRTEIWRKRDLDDRE